MSLDFEDGIKIIDGINFKINQNRMAFLFLIKTIEKNDSKTINIMLTDSAENFWLGDFDENKILKIREAMKLQGSYTEFFQSMKEMLVSNNYEIQLGRNSELDLIIEFNLQGIIINARFRIGKPFKRDENPIIYYNLLKVFVLDLYNAQSMEKKIVEEENSSLKQKVDEYEKQIKEGFLIKSGGLNNLRGSEGQDIEGIGMNQKQKLKPKTSIFNPQMRKRKAQGAKILGSDDK